MQFNLKPDFDLALKCWRDDEWLYNIKVLGCRNNEILLSFEELPCFMKISLDTYQINPVWGEIEIWQFLNQEFYIVMLGNEDPFDDIELPNARNSINLSYGSEDDIPPPPEPIENIMIRIPPLGLDDNQTASFIDYLNIDVDNLED